MIRVPYIQVLALTDDFLFNTVNVAIWSTVEPGLGIIAAGAVALRPLFRTFYSLSTRNKTTLPFSKRNSALPPHLQNSRTGQVEIGRQNIYKSSAGSEGSSEIQLRGYVGTGKGGAVVSSNPFLDGDEAEKERQKYDGISVQKTVEIRRGERNTREGSISSRGSASPNTPWPRTDRDMI